MTDKKTYYIRWSNWCCKIVMHPDEDFESDDALFIEAATRAIDSVYGSKEWGDEDEMIAFYNEKGENVIKTVGELGVAFNIKFGEDTYIYSNFDDKNPELMKTLKTSMLFANSGQWDLYELSKKPKK